MSVITEPTQELLDRTRRAAHERCVVCGRGGECGLGLHFRLCDDGSVEAGFAGKRTLQGYEGILHGGVLSALLDGAMTNCLFAYGIVAVTGRMTVRFRHPVLWHTPLTIRGRLLRSQPPLHMVSAEILQNSQIKAKATGKFMEKPAPHPLRGSHRHCLVKVE